MDGSESNARLWRRGHGRFISQGAVSLLHVGASDNEFPQTASAHARPTRGDGLTALQQETDLLKGGEERDTAEEAGAGWTWDLRFLQGPSPRLPSKRPRVTMSQAVGWAPFKFTANNMGLIGRY